MPKSTSGNRCRLTTQSQALHHFATYKGSTQSQRHIKPLHWYVACRLVLEGGFRPEQIRPRPPIVLEKKRDGHHLRFVEEVANASEATVLGGLKTKKVDVVVDKPGIGPVLAISCKGITGAFRNLTNRMEEMIGECTNLHLTYPALVLGYLFLVRANPQSALGRPGSKQLAFNDIALTEDYKPQASIERYHAALCRLAGRRSLRNDISAYEAAALVMVDMREASRGEILSASFPNSEADLGIEEFFNTLYRRYDERFVLAAPELKPLTKRLMWSSSSALLDRGELTTLGYCVRLDGALPGGV